MSAEQNIWQKGDDHLPQEKLVAYLEGRLSAEEQREVEAWLADEGMESDAIEGLQQISQQETVQLTERINHKLHKDLRVKRQPKHKFLADNKWGVVAVFVVLLLVALAYWVIRMM